MIPVLYPVQIVPRGLTLPVLVDFALVRHYSGQVAKQNAGVAHHGRPGKRIHDEQHKHREIQQRGRGAVLGVVHRNTALARRRGRERRGRACGIPVLRLLLLLLLLLLIGGRLCRVAWDSPGSPPMLHDRDCIHAVYTDVPGIAIGIEINPLWLVVCVSLCLACRCRCRRRLCLACRCRAGTLACEVELDARLHLLRALHYQRCKQRQCGQGRLEERHGYRKRHE